MRRRRSAGGVCLGAALVVFCLLATLIGASVWLIPRAVSKEIGSPSSGLSVTQRFLASWQLYPQLDDLVQPLDENGKERSFVIRMGETANSVSFRLEEAGLIRSGDTFRLYLVYSGLDTTIQAGDYQLSPVMNMLQIAQELQDATPAEVEFNILAGWRSEEIAEALPTSGLEVSPQGFLQLIRSGRAGSVQEELAEGDSLEGFLMPGSYRFLREVRADEMIAAFTLRFAETVDPTLRKQFEAHGLSLREAVNLASIIQREAVLEEEQPMIASVFYNRIAAGMQLESDPTVQYAIGYDAERKTWWSNPLTANDLAVDSPYNTYRNSGLPPGPICNPGLSALRAVAYPAESPYYFFRATCDASGRHSFVQTYDEHLQNACP